MSRRLASSSWGTALAAVAVSRLLWLGVFVAVLAIDFPGTPLLTGLRDHLVSWDAISYLSIAAHGYPAHLDYRDAFLPGFPLLVRAVTVMTRDDVVVVVARQRRRRDDRALVSHPPRARRARPGGGDLLGVAARARADSALSHRPLQREHLHRVGRGEPVLRASGELAQGDHRRRIRVRVPSHRARADPRAGARATPPDGLATASRTCSWSCSRRSRSCSTACTCRSTSAMRWHCSTPTTCRHSVCSPPRPGPDSPPPGTRWSSPPTARRVRSSPAKSPTACSGFVLCAGMWASSRIPRSLALYCTIAWLMTASLPFWRSQPRYSLALFPVVLLVADLTQRYPTRPAADARRQRRAHVRGDVDLRPGTVARMIIDSHVHILPAAMRDARDALAEVDPWFDSLPSGGPHDRHRRRAAGHDGRDPASIDRCASAGRSPTPSTAPRSTTT